jgi:hypothetical protein
VGGYQQQQPYGMQQMGGPPQPGMGESQAMLWAAEGLLHWLWHHAEHHCQV